MTSPLPIYKPAERCKQCGSSKHTVRYVPMASAFDAPFIRVAHPHLEVLCGRCGYGWWRAPLCQAKEAAVDGAPVACEDPSR